MRTFVSALLLVIALAAPAAAAGPTSVSAVRDGSTVTVSYAAPARFDNLWLNVVCDGYDRWAQVRYGQLDVSSHTFSDVPTVGCTAMLREPVMRHYGREWRILASSVVPV